MCDVSDREPAGTSEPSSAGGAIHWSIDALGERALVFRVESAGGGDLVLALDRELSAEMAGSAPREGWREGLTDLVPAGASLALLYEEAVGADMPERKASLGRRVGGWVERWNRERGELARGSDGGAASGATGRLGRQHGRLHEIPVCYGLGLDWDQVTAHTGLTVAEVMRAHASSRYTVSMMGFTPGFLYLDGLPPELATPRRDEPRTRVPAGAVGIGGAHTGLYSLQSPGGWQIIGRTPLPFFDLSSDPPVAVSPGDRVRFIAISRRTFEQLAPRDGARIHPEAGDGGGPGGMRVRRSGGLTSVQDLGRPGYRRFGIPISGAMDRLSMRAANRAVGNPESAPVLELTLGGGEFEFLEPAWTAVCGAEMDASIDGEPIPMGRAVRVPRGGCMRFGYARLGCRAYLAVAGGFRVPMVMGSASTYPLAGIGGIEGRALAAGDVVRFGRNGADGGGGGGGVELVSRRWEAPAELGVHQVVPILKGPEWEDAPERVRGWLCTSRFRVGNRSDRMGVRLRGDAEPPEWTPPAFASSPVVPGVIQLPPNGEPIVLMMDAQTLGGYPRLAVVPDRELWRIAQLRPGDTLEFSPIA